ncbi:MAG TPA: 2-oxoglutarate dehydrogenase complex dihydrolipoyllysine-residue succinyltransferase [Terriglobales bacterium]|nr:2-oxoglutarate dehydrogenase complex dihydrolipoyllysine-residue succinyltransferase [Terriglobales bacterium]
MTVEVKVPHLAESITDATLAEWLKPDGQPVKQDEPIATLETDKAAVEIAATESGVLHHVRRMGEVVRVDDVLARIEPGGAPAGAPTTWARPEGAQVLGPAASGPGAAAANAPLLSPAVRRLVEEHGIDPALVSGTGRGGRVLKEDVLRHVEGGARTVEAEPSAPGPSSITVSEPYGPAAGESAPAAAPARAAAQGAPAAASAVPSGGERVVPMNRIRQRIAERLVESQHTTATLTTFNEVDMSAIVSLRARWRESFEQRHGVRLGLMSFFARACVLALGEIPEVNAEIRGSDIVYHDFVHLGVAVQTDRGLVVPVVHDAHRLSFADLEREIARLATKAREHRLSLEDLAGGTFTLSNGGVFGSLLSTPILNPPQSGILGMHKIEKRPVVIDDQVVVRPMMYVALSYDHRLVDAGQSVVFLVKVKEKLENPERMLLDV